MKIRFLFTKNKGPTFKNGRMRWLKAQAIGQGIVIWTWVLAVARLDFKSLKYNFRHVEVWFPDDVGLFSNIPAYADPKAILYGKYFSATTRGENKGVRFAPASEVLKHPNRWDYIEVEVKDERIENYMPVFQEKVGLAYDFAGIAGFALPFNPQDKNKWFCSEICAWVAFVLWILPYWHKRISPRRLAKLLVEAGGELKSLT